MTCTAPLALWHCCARAPSTNHCTVKATLRADANQLAQLKEQMIQENEVRVWFPGRG